MNKKFINKTKGYKYKNNILIMSSDNESDYDSELSSPESFTTEENKSDKDETTFDEEEDGTGESCYSCGSKSKSVDVVCCDCGVKMCKQCSRNEDSNNCGCYGNCSNCDKNINRGKHNWPCSKCDEWYCGELCRKTSDCDDCLDKIDKDAYIEELEEKIKKLEKKLQNIKNIIN